jgi:hypothetical protein
MNDEQALRHALHEAARDDDVDVPRLYAATRARLVERSRQPERRTTPARLVAWTAGGAVAAGLVIGLGVLATSDREDRSVVDASGPVADEFACPTRPTTDFAADDSFLPELSDDGRPAGEATAAPRHEVAVGDGGATLFSGNADGTLASVTTFERVDERYRRVGVVKCVNDTVPGSASAPLLAPELADVAPELLADDVAEDAVLVLDRLTYDVAGLSKRITAYAYACEARACLLSGSPLGTQVVARLPRTPAPEDLTSLLADPDDVVGTAPDQRLIGVHDAEGSSRVVSWLDERGNRRVVRPIEGGAWPGDLYLMVVPTESVDAVEVEGPRGAVATYPVEDLRR